MRHPAKPHTPLPGIIALLLILPVLWFTAGAPEADSSDMPSFDHQHRLFDQILDTYVRDGLVNYSALKNDQEDLDRYLATLAAVDPEHYEEWTREQKLAFWINAYNAYTIKVILNHYPIGHSFLADPLRRYPADSIRQIPGVWKFRKWPVAGNTYTLDHMEHVIMRQEIVEPRIHFVLVCASIGCPWLESRAFDAETLEQRLDQAGINYIYSARKVIIDQENRVVGLPQIFNWFHEDFQPLEESAAFFTDYPPEIAGPLTWIYRYANEEDRAFLRSGSFRVEFLFYDWGLNELE